MSTLIAPFTTRSGWVYVRRALHNPPGYLIAHPIFFPDENGDRKFFGRIYKKYRPSPKPNQTQPYPWEPITGFHNVLVPIGEIVKEFDCLEAYRRWNGDERKVIMDRLVLFSGIPEESVGLCGSWCMDCASEESDVDIMIYGLDFAHPLIKAIKNFLENGIVSLPSSKMARERADRYKNIYGIEVEKLENIFSKNITDLYILGKRMSIIFAYDNREKHLIPTKIYTKSSFGEKKFQGYLIHNTRVYPNKFVVRSFEDERLYEIWSHTWIHKGLEFTGRVEVVGELCGENLIRINKLHHRLLPVF